MAAAKPAFTLTQAARKQLVARVNNAIDSSQAICVNGRKDVKKILGAALSELTGSDISLIPKDPAQGDVYDFAGRHYLYVMYKGNGSPSPYWIDLITSEMLIPDNALVKNNVGKFVGRFNDYTVE